MKKLKQKALLLAGAFLLTACENPISSMTDTAEEAATNSGLAAESAAESREEIATGRMMSRLSSSSESRENHFETILESESFEAKVLAAGKWMKALEFQHWTGQRHDTKEVLEAMYTEAITEYFSKVSEFNGGVSVALTSLSPTPKGTSEEELADYDKALNVYAMAVAMHSLATTNEYTTVKNVSGHEAKSFFDLIEEGLDEFRKVEKGELAFQELKPWVQKLSEHKEEALAMVNNRANMLLMMVITRVTTIKEVPREQAGAMLMGEKISSRFSELNIGKQNAVNRYLGATLQSIGVMAKNEMEPSIDGIIKLVFSKLDTPVNPGNSRTPELQSHLFLLNKLFPKQTEERPVQEEAASE